MIFSYIPRARQSTPTTSESSFSVCEITSSMLSSPNANYG
jgi:hypothetical protein